jgi:hypothetical protein
MKMEKQRNTVAIGAATLGVLCFWDKGRQTVKGWFGIEEKIHVTVEAEGETSTVEV